MGRYADAEEALEASNISYVRWNRLESRSDLHAEMRYLQADVLHLRNRYDESAQAFEELAAWAEWAGLSVLRARCVWAQGHVLRHQGQDLDRSLRLFADAEILAGDLGELDLKAYAVTSATAIKVFQGDVPTDEAQRLDRIEAELAATSTHDGLLIKVWKAQAQVSWYSGHHDGALAIIEAAIESAQARNDRALYNLYFERAEYRRLGGDSDPAIADYQRVLEFGEDNGDRNLVANALLGRALAALSNTRSNLRSVSHEAREAALRARTLAWEADIHATARNAERVTMVVDDPTSSGTDIRLVLF
jgi:tetratricopeptide (TPR) repeat protein